jgi:Mce-associated membrane protein
VVLGIVALLILGAVVAIVVSTAGDDENNNHLNDNATNPAEARTAAARDDALADGRTAVEVFNTLDYRDVEAGLDRWEAVATGELLTQLTDGRKTSAAIIRQQKTMTTAEVLDAALAEFDEAAGTATLLAAVSVDATHEGQEPVNKRTRITATLERDGDEWKVSELSTT